MKPEDAKGIVPDTPREVLAWRVQTGADRLDEAWEGYYHVAPEKSKDEVDFELALECWLLEHWGTQSDRNVFREVRVVNGDQPATDFRVPNLCLVETQDHDYLRGNQLHATPRVVIEILASGKSVYDKMAFYLKQGVSECWVFSPENFGLEIFQRGGKNGDVHVTRTGEAMYCSAATDLRLMGNGSRFRLEMESDQGECHVFDHPCDELQCGPVDGFPRVPR